MGNIKFQLRKINEEKESNVVENRKQTKKHKDLYRIYLVYWVNGIRFVYSTGQKTIMDEWNKGDQRAVKRNGRSDLAALNNVLDVLSGRVKTAERELITEGLPINNRNLKKKVDKLSGKSIEKKKYSKIVDFGEDVVKRYKKLGKYPKAINSSVELIKSYRPSLTFEDIDTYFHDELITYMKDEKLNKKKNYSKNYIAKVIATIKLLMNLANEEGHTKNIKHKSLRFKVQKEKVYNIYLSTNELETLHKHDFSNTPYLDNACDLFLLGAFTGLRFSDFNDLKGVNFVDGEFIIQDTMKVTSRLIIPQHRIVKEILAKRNGELPHSISNVKLNKYLKKIGEEAEIDQNVIKVRTEGKTKKRRSYKKYKLITTHTARRSLATNMYLAGIQIKTIMTITGHSSVAQLMSYIKVTEVEVAESLKDHDFFK